MSTNESANNKPTPDKPPASTQTKSANQPSQLSLKEIITSLATEPTEDLTLDQTSNLLTQKAFFLLGLADQLEKDGQEQSNTQSKSPKSRDLISTLQQDAKECMSFAMSMKDNATELANQQIQTVQSNADPETMAKFNKFKAQLGKYDQFADELVLRTQGITKDAVSSDECKDFLVAGQGVLNKWLEKREQVVGKLLDANDETLTSLDRTFAELAGEKGSLADIITDFRVDVVVFLNSLTHHKETIMKAVDDIEDVLEEKDETGHSLKDDEDLMLLYNKVMGRVDRVTAAASDDQTNENLETTMDTLLDTVESNDLVKKGLARATEMLQSNELDPDILLDDNASTKNLQKFITLIKNELLAFLLGYLPTVTIKPLEHDDDHCTYKLENIDLSKFMVKSEDVEVMLIENGLFLCASKITCEMDDLKFNYASKSFPYPRCSGKLHGLATEISVALELRLEVTAYSDPPSATISASDHVSADTYHIEEDEQVVLEHLKSVRVSPSLTPMHTPTATPAISMDLNTPEVSTSRVSIGDSTTNANTKDYTVTKRLLNKINSRLDNRYKLVLFHHKTHGLVKIGNLKLELLDFSFLKSLANYLLNLFRSPIRDYVQKTINNVILKESEQLLTKINDKVEKYLPVLAKLLARIENKAPQVEKIVLDTVKTIQNDVRQDRAQLESQNVSPAEIKLELPDSDEILKKE